MSLERFGAELIMGLASQGKTLGAAAMLGRQHLDLTSQTWAKATEQRLGYRLNDIVALGLEAYAEPFFERLGCSSIDSIDFSDYQGASLLHDMNQPLPKELAGRFDLLHDGGTMEHVFHVPNYLANCMKLLRVGGYYVAVVPADNWNGHGFYQFSPELFFRVFSEVNGFELQAHGLGVWGRRHQVFHIPSDSHWKGRMEPQFNAPTLLLMIAKKVAEVAPFSTAIPQQSDYAVRWASEPPPHHGHSSFSPFSRIRGGIARIMPSSLRRQIAAHLVHSRRRRERNALLTKVASADELLTIKTPRA